MEGIAMVTDKLWVGGFPDAVVMVGSKLMQERG
jgi:hypothetical protein